MIKCEGKGGITAEIIADSITEAGERITTFKLHYPRFIHSEFMTHRMVSKNASSSRAIPVKKQLEYIDSTPAMPIHWGLNEAGMQASLETNIPVTGLIPNTPMTAKSAWEYAKDCAVAVADAMWMDGKGYHKQIVNRLTEPFTFMNVIATATDWENFFWLRLHKDAQPEICELAKVMYTARDASEPKLLTHGEWHLPFVDSFRDSEGLLQYSDINGDEVYSLEEAQKISASCCAQVSYRNLDTSLEKALGIYDRLAGMKPLHASPFEHLATPFSLGEWESRYACRNTLVRELSAFYNSAELIESLANQVMYCGNLKGWTQFRKLLPDENQSQQFVQ